MIRSDGYCRCEGCCGGRGRCRHGAMIVLHYTNEAMTMNIITY
jgi:hypothetical protein